MDIRRLFLFPHYLCNNNCKMCFINKQNKPFSYSFKEIKKIVDSSHNHNFVSIGGGEPFLYKHIVELVAYCNKDKKVDTQIFTNGTLMTLEKCITLKNAGLDSIVVTYHSNNEHEHDFITSNRGSFQKLSIGVENAQNAKIRFITAQILVHKINYKKLSEIVKYCHSIGISKFSIQNLISTKYDINLSVSLNKSAPYINNCFNYLQKNNLKWYSISIPLCYVKNQYWKNMVVLRGKKEYTNLSNNQAQNNGYEHDYGLSVPNSCIGSCNYLCRCPGSWNSYWKCFKLKKSNIIALKK